MNELKNLSYFDPVVAFWLYIQIRRSAPKKTVITADNLTEIEAMLAEIREEVSESKPGVIRSALLRYLDHDLKVIRTLQNVGSVYIYFSKD